MKSWLPCAVFTSTLCACIASGCVGGKNGSSSSSAYLGPTAIAAIGSTHTGVVGTALSTPLTALVTNAFGSHVSGTNVQFAVTSGTAILASTTTVVTDSIGEANMTVTLGTKAGTCTITATAAGVNSGAVFTLIANSAAPAKVQVVTGTPATALEVLVVDTYSNPVPGANVEFTVTSGFVSVHPAIAATDANGNASSTLTPDPNGGNWTVTASVAGAGYVTFGTPAASPGPSPAPSPSSPPAGPPLHNGKATSPPFTSAAAVACGDFDGDGKTDMVVIDNATATIFIGNGDGTFGSGSPYALSLDAGPWSVAVADLQNRNLLDIVVTGTRGGVGTAQVLTSAGAGTFTPLAAFPLLGNDPVGLVLGNLNFPNGFPALAVADNAGNLFEVFPGNGDGTFLPGSRYTVASPTAITAAPLRVMLAPPHDLVVAGSAGVSVFLNNADGTFPAVASSTYSLKAGPTALAVQILRVNSNTRDIVVANGSAVSVLLGNGDGTFLNAVDYACGSAPTRIAIALITDNGIQDVVAIDGADVRVVPGKGDGTFGAAGKITSGLSSSATGLSMGDLNGDHVSDAMVVGGTQYSVLLH